MVLLSTPSGDVSLSLCGFQYAVEPLVRDFSINGTLTLRGHKHLSWKAMLPPLRGQGHCWSVANAISTSIKGERG